MNETYTNLGHFVCTHAVRCFTIPADALDIDVLAMAHVYDRIAWNEFDTFSEQTVACRRCGERYTYVVLGDAL